jgi:hypothetical protein
MHAVEQFRERLDTLDRYPTGVVRVCRYIDGTAFFAGGPGLYCKEPPSVRLPDFPYAKTMVIGHNLDAVGSYKDRYNRGLPHGGEVETMRTWVGLYDLLGRADVNREECFFTNAYVGLIDDEHAIGPFPGRKDRQFVCWCRKFLRFQIDTMKPSVIATIGGDARRFVGRMTPDLAMWRARPSLTVSRAEIDGHSFAAVALAHPSMYPSSVRARRYRNREGEDADAALLHDAVYG